MTFAGSTLDELRTLRPTPGTQQTVATILALVAEIDRLNKWADTMTDAALKERQTGEAYQAELRAEIARLKANIPSTERK